MIIFKKNLFIILIACTVSDSLFAMESAEGHRPPSSRKERRKQRQRQLEADRSSSEEFVNTHTGTTQEGSDIAQPPAPVLQDDVKDSAPPISCAANPTFPGTPSSVQPAPSGSGSGKYDYDEARARVAAQEQSGGSRLQGCSCNSDQSSESGASSATEPVERPFSPKPAATSGSGKYDYDKVRAEMARERSGGSRLGGNTSNVNEVSSRESLLQKAKKNKLEIFALVAIAELVDFAYAYAKTTKEELHNKTLLEKAKLVAKKTYTARAIRGTADVGKKCLGKVTEILSNIRKRAQNPLNKSKQTP